MKKFAIVLQPYYTNQLCEGQEDGTHDHGRECVTRGCQGQPWVLGIFDVEEDARRGLIPMARKICPKGFNEYNTLVFGEHVGGNYSYNGSTEEILRASGTIDFVMLENDTLFCSSLTIEVQEEEELRQRMTLAKKWCKVWECDDIPDDEFRCTLNTPFEENNGS